MDLWSSVVSFAVLAGLLTIVPGLDTALVLRAALTQERRVAFATALGIGTGSLIWGAGAAVGITALLTASHVAYTALRYIGAAYMVWLGASAIAGVWRRRNTVATQDSAVTSSALTARRAWMLGLTTNLLNPKVGAFYVAVLPQFVPDDSSAVWVGLLLALVHDVEGVLWFTVLICCAHATRRWLTKRSVQRGVDSVTGAALIGFGAKLAIGDH